MSIRHGSGRIGGSRRLQHTRPKRQTSAIRQIRCVVIDMGKARASARNGGGSTEDAARSDEREPTAPCPRSANPRPARIFFTGRKVKRRQKRARRYAPRHRHMLRKARAAWDFSGWLVVRGVYRRFFWWPGTSGDKSSDPPASPASLVRTRRSRLAQTCRPPSQALSASVAPTLLVSCRREFERMAVYDRRLCMGASLPVVVYCLLAVLAHEVYEVGREGSWEGSDNQHAVLETEFHIYLLFLYPVLELQAMYDPCMKYDKMAWHLTSLCQSSPVTHSDRNEY